MIYGNGAQVLLVHNLDGDVLAAVVPADPLNPGFTRDEIESYGDFEVEAASVMSLSDFREGIVYDDGMPKVEVE